MPQLHWNLELREKAGIDRIVFEITGQGYAGGVKTVSAMTYNPRSDVYEYWVPISALEFISDGEFNVNAIVYGNDGGIRDLGTITMFANPGGTLVTYSAWVDSVNGDDSTGTLDDDTRPYKTIDPTLDDNPGAFSAQKTFGFIFFNENSDTKYINLF